MATGLSESYAYLLIMQILTAIVLLAILVLVIFQCYSFHHQMKKHHGQKSRLLSKIYSANSFTTICLLSWCIQSLISVVTSFGIGIDELGCRPILCVHFGLYFLAMLSKWYVFVYRLTIIYNSSTYEYSSIKMKILRLCIFLYVGGLLSWTWIDLKAELVIINGLHLCAFELNKKILIFLNVSDILLSIWIMVLFVRPIYTLAAAQYGDKEGSKKASKAKVQTVRRWKRLILKYFTTTFIATLSTTLLAILVIIVGNGKLICIDNMLNSFCLLLMCKGFDKYFDCFCCGMVVIFKPILSRVAAKLLNTKELEEYQSGNEIRSAPTSRNASSFDPAVTSRSTIEVTVTNVDPVEVTKTVD
eukprot:273644_1